jgi:hypothetical protein
MTPCTMPWRSSSTVLADIAISVGGTRSVSAARGRRQATIQSASATPNPQVTTDSDHAPERQPRLAQPRHSQRHHHGLDHGHQMP